MTVQELAALVITAQHGWAIAEQFESTFSGDEPFEKQNINALERVQMSIKRLFHSGVLSIEANDELEDYLTDLREYLDSIPR